MLVKPIANNLLVTIDVTSLYTNIHNVDALRVAKNTLQINRTSDSLPTTMDIVKLLALVLRCNNFEFHDKHYLQISGVGMGMKAAPTIANLHMGEFEDKYVYTYPLQPLFYGRFIDDGFFIWQHGLMELMKF